MLTGDSVVIFGSYLDALLTKALSICGVGALSPGHRKCERGVGREG